MTVCSNRMLSGACATANRNWSAHIVASGSPEIETGGNTHQQNYEDGSLRDGCCGQRDERNHKQRDGAADDSDPKTERSFCNAEEPACLVGTLLLGKGHNGCEFVRARPLSLDVSLQPPGRHDHGRQETRLQHAIGDHFAG